MVADKNTEEKKQHCTAFCPECGSDLYYTEGECYCKNSKCSWHCNCYNCK